MPPPIRLDLLRREIKSLIAANPVTVEFFRQSGGDGFTTANTWTLESTWTGVLAPLGREVYRNFHSPAGDMASKNFLITLPGDTGQEVPRRGDKVVVKDLLGNSLGYYWVNFVLPYKADFPGVQVDTTWKIEVHCEVMES